jgi:REP element-mobilizing transposase RayT
VGPYYVTICTAKRRRLLAYPIDDHLELTDLGRLTEEVWKDLPKTFPGLVVDTFVVMPDHTHGLLFLPEDGTASLSDVIRRLKAEISRQARRTGIHTEDQLWQRGYFDHVVRKDVKLDAVREYIRDNPRRWMERYAPSLDGPGPGASLRGPRDGDDRQREEHGGPE